MESFDKNTKAGRQGHSKTLRNFTKDAENIMGRMEEMGNKSILIVSSEIGENRVIYSDDRLHSPSMENSCSKILESCDELMRQHDGNKLSEYHYSGKVVEYQDGQVIVNIFKTMSIENEESLLRLISFQVLYLEKTFGTDHLKNWAKSISEYNMYLKINENFELPNKFYAAFIIFGIVSILRSDLESTNLLELQHIHIMMTSIFRLNITKQIYIPPNVQDIQKYPERDEIFNFMKHYSFILDITE